MNKKLNIYLFLLTFIFCVNGKAQEKEKLVHDAGLYSTIEWTDEEIPTIIPQGWIYLKDYYFEARFNYEDLSTMSLYFGRALTHDKKVYSEFIPMLGVVFGKMTGISPGFNYKFKFKRFLTSTQCQFTFDLNNNDNSFFWDWSNFYFKLYKGFSIGCAVQINNSIASEDYVRYSPALKFEYKAFMIEANAFNLWKKHPVWAIGLEYDFK